jgi:Haem-NO-binding
MYGMVNRAIEDMVTSGFGVEAWEKIKERAGVDIEVFIGSEGYSDQITYGLIGAASEVLGLPVEKVMEAFGEYWILETTKRGYSDLMASGGSTLKEFLLNLPNLHARLSLIFPHLAPPEFAVSNVGENSLTLHYMSNRAGLTSFMRGLILGLGKKFETPVEVELAVAKASGADHDEFFVQW